MTFAKWAFRLAAILGLLALLPMYFRADSYSAKYPPAITHPEFYYGFVGVAVAWQIAFFIISRDPVRFRPLMLAAIVEKASWGFATIALYVAGRLNMEMLGAGLFDLVFGVAFLIAYLKVPESDAAGARLTREPRTRG